MTNLEVITTAIANSTQTATDITNQLLLEMEEEYKATKKPTSFFKLPTKEKQ